MRTEIPKHKNKKQFQRFVPFANGGGEWLNCGNEKFNRTANDRRRIVKLVENVLYELDFNGKIIDEIQY